MKIRSTSAAALAAFVLAVGCSSTNGLSQQDRDRATSSLTKALSAWKKGESAKKWQDPKAPIRFVDDDWIKGHRLVEFNITEIRANTDGHPEGIVRLSLRRGKKPVVEHEALYGINVKKPNQVVIGRDPMH